MKYAIMALSCLGLCACQPASNDTQPASATTPPPAPSVSDMLEGTVLFNKTMDASVFTVPDYLSVNALDDGSVVIDGTDAEQNSQGETSGAHLLLADELEQSASGKTITIHVAGRSTSDAESTVNVAYSTADVGNSGWKNMSFGKDYSVQSFTYDVPEMNAGRGDYLGFSPAQGEVALAGVSISID